LLLFTNAIVGVSCYIVLNGGSKFFSKAVTECICQETVASLFQLYGQMSL